VSSTTDPALALAAIVVTVLATVAVGAFGNRRARSSSDFYVASRSISPGMNASAIGGEYLSAASFLGIAGLVLAYGVDMLWYPVGYTVGYLLLLVLVAAPLRRSGAYTIPDFAQGRLQSSKVRAAATVLVVIIGWLYLIPQMQGAGLTLGTVVGTPTWVGVVAVGVVVLTAVVGGGMRSITLVQAFQYWLKLFAIAVPVFFLIAAWRADGSPDVLSDTPPEFGERTTVTLTTAVTMQVAEPVQVRADGTIDDEPVDGPLLLTVGEYLVAADTTLVFPAGAEVPGVEAVPLLTGQEWGRPLSDAQSEPLYRTYSLMIALFFGTMGLPHVLVRFYTNPDGRAARRTALTVLGLVGIFYLAPPVYGALGRIYAPELLLTGRTDAVVLTLPTAMVGGVTGQLLGALVAAGAFAAFLSTSSGLVVSVAGVLAQDVLGKRGASPRRAFQLASGLAVLVPMLLTLASQRLGVASMVGLAFAVAASSFCPLLLLGIWWPRLTAPGAIAGLVAGGGLAAAAVLATILLGPADGWVGALLEQPAAWSMPLAFVTMVVVSRMTARAMPSGVQRIMVRLHTPESLGLDRGARLTGRGGPRQ
jgi:Na+(H+)/acetate symporter ActP